LELLTKTLFPFYVRIPMGVQGIYVIRWLSSSGRKQILGLPFSSDMDSGFPFPNEFFDKTVKFQFAYGR